MKFKAALPALAGLSLLAVAVLANAAEPRRDISDAVWTRKPTGEEIARLYPPKAQTAERGGWTVLSCRVDAKGGLKACQVAAESPKGWGFGAAALSLAQYFRYAPLTKSGAPIEGGYVTIPIILHGPTAKSQEPPVTYAPARPAQLITPLPSGSRAAGAFPCATAQDPQARCTANPITWKTAPEAGVSAPILRAAGQTTGVSVLDCIADQAGKLTQCEVQGDVTPGGQAAILKLAALFEAPEKSASGLPVAGGRIAAIVDWATILEADEVLAPR